jgi:hypothetical protein
LGFLTTIPAPRSFFLRSPLQAHILALLVIIHAFLGEGGLTREEIASKLVCFGAASIHFKDRKRVLPPKFVRNGCHSTLVLILAVTKSTLLLRPCLTILWSLVWKVSSSLCTPTFAKATSNMLSSRSLLISWKLRKIKC